MFGQAWSLGIEEKFYIFWPLVLFAALSTRSIAFAMTLMIGRRP